MIRKSPLTIEGDLAPPRRRRRWETLRTGLFAGLAVGAIALAAAVALSPPVTAGPEATPVEAPR